MQYSAMYPIKFKTLRATGAFSFSRRAPFLTTSHRLVVVSPAGTGALREGLRFLRKAPDNAAMPVGAGRHCLRGKGTRCASSLCRLRKPATGSFVAVMGGVPSRPSSFCEKKQKPRAEKGECDWQYTI